MIAVAGERGWGEVDGARGYEGGAQIVRECGGDMQTLLYLQWVK